MLIMLSENSCGGTPSSIPNLEVKPINAESTWREASWEDRNSLSFFYFLQKDYSLNRLKSNLSLVFVKIIKMLNIKKKKVKD
jgi:hypothetical protein